MTATEKTSMPRRPSAAVFPGPRPAVRARVEAVTQKTMEAVADTVAADTGLDRAAAELLSTALTGRRPGPRRPPTRRS